MRIKKTDSIGGVPIEQVRHLLRRLAYTSFTSYSIQAVLGISEQAADRLLNALLAEGHIEAAASSPEYYECTLKGSALAGATLAPPLRAETVKRLLKEVVERARAINRNQGYVYRIQRIELFGSVLRGSERPSDVDLAVTLEPRYDEAFQRKAEHERIARALREGRRFSNMIDELDWPRMEVFRALRNRARGLSISQAGTPQRLHADVQVIFEANDETNHGRRA